MNPFPPILRAISHLVRVQIVHFKLSPTAFPIGLPLWTEFDSVLDPFPPARTDLDGTNRADLTLVRLCVHLGRNACLLRGLDGLGVRCVAFEGHGAGCERRNEEGR